MKNNKYIIQSALVLFFMTLMPLLTGCSEDEIDTFDENNYLSFQRDALSYTFAFSADDVSSATFELPVTYAGRYSDVDQLFRLEAVAEKSTAKEGTDYQLVDPSEQVIKAGTNSGVGKIKLLRTAALKSESLKLVLAIAANDNFLPGVVDTLTVTISDQIVQPTWWDYTYSRWLGQYTKTKLLLWLEFMGVTDGSNPLDVDEYSYYQWYTGYTEPSIIYKDWTVIPKIMEFRQWLLNTKGNPMDADLGIPVAENLGTF